MMQRKIPFAIRNATWDETDARSTFHVKASQLVEANIDKLGSAS